MRFTLNGGDIRGEPPAAIPVPPARRETSSIDHALRQSDGDNGEVGRSLWRGPHERAQTIAAAGHAFCGWLRRVSSASAAGQSSVWKINLERSI